MSGLGKGSAWSWGVSASGGPGPGGGMVRGGAWWRPPRTATAAGGTHPTGMYSCSLILSLLLGVNRPL